MLDTEQGTTPVEPETTPTNDASFEALLGEVDQIEPDAPSDVDASPPAAGTTPPAATAPASTKAPALDGAAPTEATTPATEAPSDGEAAVTPPTTDAAPTDAPAWSFRVDGRDVAVPGAREDGENIVIPKAAWNTQVKNFLADRGAITNRERQYQATVKQLQTERGVNEQTAQKMLGELDRIMGLPDAESFDQWEAFKQNYAQKKQEAERDYWKERATGGEQTQHQRAQAEAMQRFVPELQQHLGRWTDEALASEQVAPLVKDMDAGEKKAFRDRLYSLLLEDADAGRIFRHTGKMQPNGLLPVLDVDFGRIAAVVTREVGVARATLDRVAAMKEKLATLEKAAQENAAAEARRTGSPAAPPPISPKASSGAGAPPKPAKTWDDLMDEVDKL